MRVASLLAVLVLVFEAGAIACDECGGSAGNLDNRAVEGRAYDWTAVSTGRVRSTGSPRCVYETVSSGEFAAYFDEALRSALPFGARFYRVRCDGGDWRYGWWVPGRPVHRDGAFHDLLQESIDRLAPDHPQLRLSPAASARHVTGVPTWLAVAPESFATLTRTVSAGAASVVLTLEPREVVWTTGEGTVQVCEGPGAAFDPSIGMSVQSPSCAHTWTSIPAHVFDDPAAAHFTVTARVVYDASYTLTAGGRLSSGALGWVAGPVTSADVIVREYQAVRVAPG